VRRIACSFFLGRQVEAIALVKNSKRELFLDGIKVKKASLWLESLET